MGSLVAVSTTESDRNTRPIRSQTGNWFLSEVKRELIQRVGPIGDPFGYYTVPISYAGEPYDLPFIYFINGSCVFDKTGACIECNFGRREHLSDDALLARLKPLIVRFEGRPAIYLTPSGSLFDDKEVPEPVRNEILRQIRASGFEFFATESRAEFLTASKLAAARQILGDHIEMEIGLGLESTNDWIRRNCINKYLSLERFLQAVEECHRHKATVYAHVLTKPPFISELEAIDDAVATTVWAFEHSVDRVGLALMNIKPGTLTHWLAQRGMYRPPMLWTIVRILLLLPVEWRSRVGLFGFNSSVDIELPAANCPVCSAHMRSLLQAFCYTRDVDFLYQAEEYPCGCKASWLEELRRSYPPLPQRVASRYEALGRHFLGDDWWEANQSLVLAELRGEDDVTWR